MRICLLSMLYQRKKFLTMLTIPVVLSSVLFGCSQSSQNTSTFVEPLSYTSTGVDTTQDIQAINTLTIYTSQSKQSLQPIIEAFSQQTGISVRLVHDLPMSLLARLKIEGENTPADMLLTQDVGIIAQAMEAGMLQPFNSEKVSASSSENLRSTQSEWVALSYYPRTIVYNSQSINANDISTYAELAKPKWQYQLCLTDGKQIANQSLVAYLEETLGHEKTVQVLQGWVSNLATEVFFDDNALLKAIDSGKCRIGIVNSDVYGEFISKNPQSPVKIAWANQGYGGVYVNANVAGIIKNSKHPEFALAFIEWLSDKNQQGIYASLSNTYPINSQAEASVLLKSWEDFEKTNTSISRYIEKQADMVELMKEAGYY